MTASSTEHLDKILNAMLVMEENINVKLQGIAQRLTVLERDVGVSYRKIQDVHTFMRRLPPYIKSAMKTLHEAFLRVTTGIMNLREETSEFAGTILYDNLEHDD